MNRRVLPPLNALRAFEAFGRLGRMTAAADELFVTHGAVSRQIRQLEQWLGFALTEGPKTALRLTPDAFQLLQATTAAFDQIEAATPKTSAASDHDLRLACYGTFAIRWLIPRLPDFVASHSDIRIHVREASGLIDFNAEDVDAAIQIRSVRDEQRLEQTPLISNDYGPVLSPALFETGGMPASVLTSPRLHTRTWPQAWTDWAQGAGMDLADAPIQRSFDHFSHALEAAVAGLGVAMAPWLFVADDVRCGRLIAPLGFLRLPGQVEFVRPHARKTAAGDFFRIWLLEQSSRMPSAPVMTPDAIRALSA